MVIPSFVEQALRNDPITVFGSGEQTRCFAYVGEAVECLIRLANARNVVGEVINVGNDQEITMNRLAEAVKEISGSPVDIVHVPYDRAYKRGFEDMQRRVPCLQKLERLIGYRPSMLLEQIVKLVVSDMRGSLEPAWSSNSTTSMKGHSVGA
jgi:UDP-glucose 4-epimerase